MVQKFKIGRLTPLIKCKSNMKLKRTTTYYNYYNFFKRSESINLSEKKTLHGMLPDLQIL